MRSLRKIDSEELVEKEEGLRENLATIMEEIGKGVRNVSVLVDLHPEFKKRPEIVENALFKGLVARGLSADKIAKACPNIPPSDIEHAIAAFRVSVAQRRRPTLPEDNPLLESLSHEAR